VIDFICWITKIRSWNNRVIPTACQRIGVWSGKLLVRLANHKGRLRHSAICLMIEPVCGMLQRSHESALLNSYTSLKCHAGEGRMTRLNSIPHFAPETNYRIWHEWMPSGRLNKRASRTQVNQKGAMHCFSPRRIVSWA